ncbi:MAG: cytochrome c biogenesis protein CcdA [Candidatus Omnitrophota bacterium]|nr:cytochrome c biogenesis protein CcdA [Candidatus Omnitrophota bacterium]
MQNYFFHFLTFFITGLAVNLTPCVYPMLTVTVSLFKPPQASPATGGGQQVKFLVSFGRAFVYVLGMAVMYSSLGVFAAMTGALFGGILQNKWVVLTVAILMLGLALSMFGVFQFRVPPGLLQKLERLRKVRFFGLFFAGMFVGIFAAPCIGPPVLALLTSVADRGNPFLGFLSFFIFSLGLGFPYLILGTFSGLLKKIPKAGNWLIWVEHAFGVILLGFSFYYFVIAFNPEFVKWVPPVTLILGGLYLGFIEKSGKEKSLFVRLKWVAGLVSLIFGLSIIASILTPKESLVWDEYNPYKVAMAKEKKQPVVIDFYADWCITCHELENFVFTNPTVAKQLKKFVRLRVDATDMMAPSVQQVLEQYRVFGLPMIVFLDENGQEVEDARVAGYVPPEEFLKFLEMVLNK